MTYEFRELTIAEEKMIGDYTQRIANLMIVEKPKIQTERATAEIGWNTRISDINKDIASNDLAIATIRRGTADGKTFAFRALTDAEAKTISDLQQKNASLKAEIVKIDKERTIAEGGWSNRSSDIDLIIHDLGDSISNIRTATEK